MKRITIFVQLCLLIVFALSQTNMYVQAKENNAIDEHNIYNLQDLQGGEINGVSVCRVGETNLGDLIADALVSSVKQSLEGSKYEKYPIIGLQNGGGIRDSIGKGEINKEKIEDVLPYKNKLIACIVTPALLYEILENGVSRVEQKEDGMITGTDGRFPQVSGMKFIYDCSKKAMNMRYGIENQGERILDIYLDNQDTPLNRQDNETNIILATTDYCLNGNDGYSMLSNTNVICEGEVLSDIVYEYMLKISNENNGIIEYYKGDRITIGEGKSTDKNIGIVVNGRAIESEPVPIIEDYTLLIPIRTVFECLGYQVEWKSADSSVYISKNNYNIRIFLKEEKFVTNSKTVSIAGDVKLINNYTMISIEALRDLIKTDAVWDSKYNTVFITHKI